MPILPGGRVRIGVVDLVIDHRKPASLLGQSDTHPVAPATTHYGGIGRKERRRPKVAAEPWTIDSPHLALCTQLCESARSRWGEHVDSNDLGNICC